MASAIATRFVQSLSVIGIGMLAPLVAAAQTATIDITSGDAGCYTLYAGQTIDAGEVCFTPVQEPTTEVWNLFVTFNTTGGWQLSEAHLWVGDVLDAYPQTKSGNPKIGNFPYNSGALPGDTTYTFVAPMGPLVPWDLENLSAHCGETASAYALAHAALQRVDSTGAVVQTETGWSDGEGALQKGSWVTRTTYALAVTCEKEPPPPPPTKGQETAIMFGSMVLNDKTDGICEYVDEKGETVSMIVAKRWGWQEFFPGAGTFVRPIYAAAGNNVLTNGTHVGDATVTVTATQVTVLPTLFSGYEALETHIYIGKEPICDVAFGNAWKTGNVLSTDTSNGVWVGLHQSVTGECEPRTYDTEKAKWEGPFCNN